MREKKCCICQKPKEEKEFQKDRSKKDGLNSWCRECGRIKDLNYSRSKHGLITSIYKHQRRHSKIRNHPLPTYTKEELRHWLTSQEKFHILHQNWAESRYKKRLRPSCDRLDDYKFYTLDNIRLVTWGENEDKGNRDRRMGINNKKSKAVIGVNRDTGEEVEFYSASEAERRTGIAHNSIGKCCNGNLSSAGNYVWRHKNG